MLKLQSAQICEKCTDSCKATETLRGQLKEARQVLRQEVAVNESTAAYLDQILTEGGKAAPDWRTKVTGRPTKHLESLNSQLKALAEDERDTIEKTLQGKLSDLGKKAKEDMEFVAQLKAKTDAQLLNVTETNINLETDVRVIYSGESSSSYAR